VRYPALDSAENPATLSQAILEGILRGELKYQGAVISDDLEMAALDHLTPAEKAVRCIQAGVDLLLEGNPRHVPAVEIAAQMAEGLSKAVACGALGEEVLRESACRVEKLLGQAKAVAEAKEGNMASLGAQEHKKLAQSMKA
jgi:beta-N-acetylhexosaminidase